MINTFDSKIYRSINDIGIEQWHQIFPSTLEDFHFIQSVEESLAHEYQFFYVVIYKNNSIVCIAPCFITEYSLDTTIQGPFKRLTAWVRKWLPKFLTLRTLIAGYPTSLGHIGINAEHAQEIAPHFHHAMDHLAKQEHASITAFKDFGPEYLGFLDTLKLLNLSY